MKHGVICIWFVTMVMVLAACSGGKQSAVEGNLVDWNGKPVAGVKITAAQIQPIKGYEQFEAVTGLDGSFCIRGLFPSSQYVLRPWSDKWTCETAVQRESAPLGETAVLPSPMVISQAFSKNTGALVTDLSTGATRFTFSSEGVIEDLKTGLEWLAGVDYDVNYAQVEQLVAGAGDSWRIPTRKELAALYQKGVGERNMDPIFKTTGWHVWAEPRDSKSAWYFSFKYGTGGDCPRVGYDGRSNRIYSEEKRWFAVRSRVTSSARSPQSAEDEGSKNTHSAVAPDSDITRFTVSSDGVITDAKTGLEWVVGPDQDTNYTQAEEWVAGCTVAGGDWRMPTQRELATLYEKGKGERNMDPAFKTTGSWVWSEPRDSTSAWCFRFYDGRERWCSCGSSGGGRSYAVRSKRQTSTINVINIPNTSASGTARFTVSSDGVITDGETGLEWIVGPDQDTNYIQAEEWVAGCTVAGGDWRMPMEQELATLFQKGVGEQNMNPAFGITGWFVWIEPRNSSSLSWFFDFHKCLSADTSELHNGHTIDTKSTHFRVFAVRSRSDTTRFTVSSDGVITDAKTGLEWVVGPDQDTNYTQAEEWVAGCTVAGGGWRMPTRQDIGSLYQKGVGVNNRDPVFKMSGSWVWAKPRDSSAAWFFNFGNGKKGSLDRDSSYPLRVFSVRSRSEMERASLSSLTVSKNVRNEAIAHCYEYLPAALEELAGSMEEDKGVVKACALSDVAYIYAYAGDHEKSQALFSEVKAMGPPERALDNCCGLAVIGCNLVRAGEKEQGDETLLEAKRSIESLKEEWERDLAMSSYVNEIACIQRFDAAETALQSIKDDSYRTGAELNLALALAYHGERERALTFLDKSYVQISGAEFKGPRERYLTSLGEGLALCEEVKRAEDTFAQAEEAIKSMEDPISRAMEYAWLAARTALSGTEEAPRLMAKAHEESLAISDTKDRELARTIEAQAYAYAGEFDRAFEIFHAPVALTFKNRVLRSVISNVKYHQLSNAGSESALAARLMTSFKGPRVGAGIAWLVDYDAALEKAKDESKPLVVYFRADWADFCKEMEEYFQDLSLAEIMQQAICVQVDMEKNVNAKSLSTSFSVVGCPDLFVVDTSGNKVGEMQGCPPGTSVKVIRDYLDKCFITVRSHSAGMGSD